MKKACCLDRGVSKASPAFRTLPAPGEIFISFKHLVVKFLVIVFFLPVCAQPAVTPSSSLSFASQYNFSCLIELSDFLPLIITNPDKTLVLGDFNRKVDCLFFFACTLSIILASLGSADRLSISPLTFTIMFLIFVRLGLDSF